MTKKHLLYAILILTVTAVLGLTGYWAYWNYYARWQPITISRKQTELQALLDASGYASLGREGREMWVITYRDCDSCRKWEAEELPRFEALPTDIRIVPFALFDIEGKTKSTPSERSTLAELWLNRSYSLYKQWRATPEELWQPTFRPADGDLARTAVVQASRDFITRLEPMMAENGVEIRYPLIIWRDGTEHIKVCACSDQRMYHFVRESLNAPAAPTQPGIAPQPSKATAAETAASDSAAEVSAAPADYGPDAL